ncbi:phytoene desaturase [Bacillus sp. FJAT-42376]|uniref:phytoene desaturase family protein n=1 Tax=Bacillus sp. FJAT-42376 TaxID=2014076 RepID=UPI000F508149|nr:phytoene desaturase family protein [Bacillus sp. FJAT-42376]AZB42297.1 phytoene desaturase [Bacillus sp. FJAT-42376]
MRATIAGGGIGGLITALLMKKNGFNVTIFEKNDRLGGRLAYVKEGEYKIDEGPTIVLLPEMLQRILREAGISDSEYELVSLDPLYKLHFADGTTYSKYSDYEKQMDELKNHFPGEEKGFQRFMKDMDTRFRLGNDQFLEKTFVDRRSFWTQNNIRTLMKLKAYRNVHQSLKAYYTDERLRQAYSLQTLYIGGNPFESPAIYSLVSYSEHKHGVYYMRGGYARLVEVLEEALIRNGVEIRKNALVQSVKSDGVKAQGLYVNGDYHETDYLIMNGDFPSVTHMLEPYAPKREYVPSSGCLLLYMGLDKVYNEANVHQFFMGSDFQQHMHQIFVSKEVPSDPSIYAFHPSIIDSSLAPEGKSVLYALIPVPSGSHIDWDQQNEFTDRIIETLERRGFPGLRDHIVWKKVKSPNDAKREGLFEGGSFGLAPTLFQSGVFRPQVKPSKLENVYAAGASIHPGGGIPLVMQGAKMMVSVLMEDANIHKGVSLSGKPERSVRTM